MNSMGVMVNTGKMNYPVIATYKNARTFEEMILVTTTEDIIRSLVQEIANVKKRLIEAITNYIDGAKATIETVTDILDTRYRKMKRAEEFVSECESYRSELTNFTINSIDSVNYRGNEHTVNESVRRLTINHLEALQEKISYIGIKSEQVVEIQKEYEILLKQFIQMVRSYFY